MGGRRKHTCGAWFTASCADWLTALNGPHEFDKHEPVPKENRHEEIGERAMAALNSTTEKSVTGDSGCGFV
jgi:hypothetical protein